MLKSLLEEEKGEGEREGENKDTVKRVKWQ